MARPIVVTETVSRAYTVVRRVGIQEAISRPLTMTSCPFNYDGNSSVGIGDLLAILANWGPANPDGDFLDFNFDGEVGINDLLEMLASWGPCR